MFAMKAAVRSLRQYVRSVTYQEIKIPVPWGHIAGKWWGPQDKQPILTLHGWQDNCGTFDLLIPSLPKHLSYLAIDLPGNGYSSWLPPGTFYHQIDSLVTIRRIQKYMGWNKVSFMGHSLGATVCYAFGLVYPQEVDFIICLDGLQPRVKLNDVSEQSLIETFFKYSEQTSPCYTLEEMQKLNVRHRKISLDKIQYILNRGIKEVTKGRYCLTRDPRIKCPPFVTWSGDFIKAKSKTINFPLLFIMYDIHKVYEEKENLGNFFKTLDILKVGNKDLRLVEMEAEHHDHLNEHEKFTQIVTDFVIEYDKLDRSCDQN